MDIGTLVVRLLPVLGALAFATLVEALVPLRGQSRRLNGRLTTNLWLLAITLTLGMLLNFTLALGAAYVGASGMGLLQLLGIGPIASFVLGLVALDGASYACSVRTHRVRGVRWYATGSKAMTPPRINRSVP